MDKPKFKRKDVLFVGLFFILVLMLIWVLSAKGPEGDYYAFVFGYGNTITMKNREVAELYRINSPGVYLVNKEGQFVAPVQGGVKMALKGLTDGDGRQVEVGLKGIRIGLKVSPVGKTVLTVLTLIPIGLVAYRFLRSRRSIRHA